MWIASAWIGGCVAGFVAGWLACKRAQLRLMQVACGGLEDTLREAREQLQATRRRQGIEPL